MDKEKKKLKMTNFRKILLSYLCTLIILVVFLLMVDFYYSSFNYIINRDYQLLNLKKYVLYVLAISPFILYYFLTFYLINNEKEDGYYFGVFIFVLVFLMIYYTSCYSK